MPHIADVNDAIGAAFYKLHKEKAIVAVFFEYYTLDIVKHLLHV